MTALGVALLLLALPAIWRARRSTGWAPGLGLLVGGVLAAMGPVLYAGGQLRGLGSTALPLPVAMLEALGWLTKQGGLYFRYAVIAELGLVLLGALSLRGRRHARWIAGAVLCLHIAEGVHASGPWSDRTRSPVHGRTTLITLAGSDGAVLELPVPGPTDGWFGQGALLRAVYHQRPTTGLPRAIQDRNHPVQRTVREAFRQIDPELTRSALRAAGYRLVVLPEALVPHVQPSFADLTQGLAHPSFTTTPRSDRPGRTTLCTRDGFHPCISVDCATAAVVGGPPTGRPRACRPQSTTQMHTGRRAGIPRPAAVRARCARTAATTLRESAAASPAPTHRSPTGPPPPPESGRVHGLHP